jgi:N-acyl amino acid synthase of PEP-CTERM/exosortase system
MQVLPPSSDQARPPTTNPLRSIPLVEAYQKLFVNIPADTPELQQEAYRLRYQVYCIERKFEDPSQNPSGLERDEYDNHSVQALLLHRESRKTVGTIRLVLPKPGAREGSLPFHSVCHHPRLRDPNFLPFETTAELSRFAISKVFRQREGDAAYGRVYGPDDLMRDPRRVIPHLTLGLMTVALQMGNAHGVRYACAVMEPALLRLVERFGLHFEPLGPLVEYHGRRQPCYANVEELIAGIEATRPDVWEVVTDCGRLWKPTRRPLAVTSYQTA